MKIKAIVARKVVLRYGDKLVITLPDNATTPVAHECIEAVNKWAGGGVHILCLRGGAKLSVLGKAKRKED